jgi:putative Ca2+/H+ antiporter (TMEM165/GDT1 family)
MDAFKGIYQEALKWLPGMHFAYSVVTVVMVQIFKGLFLPVDPGAPIGRLARFTAPKRFERWLQVATFAIAMALSVSFDPHEEQTLRGKIGDGFQTAAAAIFLWEAYKAWVRPKLTGG